MKHTPEPWKVDTITEEQDYLIVNDTGLKSICLVHNHSNTASDPEEAEREAEANARLIVAAPDLLEGARFAVKAIRDAINEGNGWKVSLEDALDQLGCAIERAEKA